MKLGNKEIPNMRLPALIPEVRTLYEKVGVSEVDPGVIAEFLGHKSAASGAFLTKIASMRDYGLMDGRGKMRISAIGQVLSEPKSTDDARNQAMIDSLNKIPLWRVFYEKWTKKGLGVPDADFWNDLREACGLTIEEAKNSSASVLNAYKEDIKLLRTGSSNTPTMPPNTGSGTSGTTPSAQGPASQATPEGMMDAGFGEVKVFLPKEGTKAAWTKLKRMVDALLEDDKDEPKKAK